MHKVRYLLNLSLRIVIAQLLHGYEICTTYVSVWREDEKGLCIAGSQPNFAQVIWAAASVDTDTRHLGQLFSTSRRTWTAAVWRRPRRRTWWRWCRRCSGRPSRDTFSGRWVTAPSGWRRTSSGNAGGAVQRHCDQLKIVLLSSCRLAILISYRSQIS